MSIVCKFWEHPSPPTALRDCPDLQGDVLSFTSRSQEYLDNKIKIVKAIRKMNFGLENCAKIF
jgi:hypothetical protein